MLDARLPEFCRGCGDNSVGITTAGDCQIGIGGIGYNLYAFRIESLPLQFPGEGNPQLDLSFAEELVQFLVGMNDVFHGEVLAGIQTIDNMAGVRVYGRRENGCLHVPYFRGYGESEQDDLHDRHPDKDQHGASVP